MPHATYEIWLSQLQNANSKVQLAARDESVTRVYNAIVEAKLYRISINLI